MVGLQDASFGFYLTAIYLTGVSIIGTACIEDGWDGHPMKMALSLIVVATSKFSISHGLITNK